MREERAYTHQTCHTETEVSGPEFQAMSNPLAGMQTTYCVQCEDQFPVEEFAWSDTNETIAAYYARHCQKATPSDLWWGGRGGMAAVAGGGLVIGIVLGFVIGAVSSLLIGIIAGVVLALAGAVAGAVLHEPLIVKPITRRVCGVEDTRELN